MYTLYISFKSHVLPLQQGISVHHTVLEEVFVFREGSFTQVSLNTHCRKLMKTLVMYGQVLHNLYSITSLTLYSHHAKIEGFLSIYSSPQQASLQS